MLFRSDKELMAMLESGKSQKECADHFNVSKSAITQRVQKLKAHAVPESFKKLTGKQKEFVLCKVEGKSNLQAAKASYDVTSDASGKALATQLMRDPDIGLAIQDLMAQTGIPRRRRIERLRDMIECHDLSVAGKGLDMSFKLAGDYAPQQIEVISESEIRALIALVSQPQPVDMGKD